MHNANSTIYYVNIRTKKGIKIKKKILLTYIFITLGSFNIAHSMTGRFSRLANPTYRQYFKTWAPAGIAGAATGLGLYNTYNFNEFKDMLNFYTIEKDEMTKELEQLKKELAEKQLLIKKLSGKSCPSYISAGNRPYGSCR